MKPLPRGIPHLLTLWDRVVPRIRAGARVAVFLDFDGTLVDIAPRPDQVHLKPKARDILQRLARHPRITVVVVSGRRRAELLQYIGVRGIRYFGLYGWERSSKCALPTSVRQALRRARTELTRHLRAHPSIWIEPRSMPGKGIAVRQFLGQPAFRRSFPIYFGDDLSDESGFVAVRRGFSVLVGQRSPTRARYSVHTPAEVATALAKLEVAVTRT